MWAEQFQLETCSRRNADGYVPVTVRSADNYIKMAENLILYV
jgi:hypothetical protein